MDRFESHRERKRGPATSFDARCALGMPRQAYGSLHIRQKMRYSNVAGVKDARVTVNSGTGMDIQKLKYFVAVAESLSFSEAASNVGISQSAMSQQIAELERQVKTQLIIRKKRPLQLTSAGKVLLKESYSLVAKADEALHKTHQAAKGYVGFLKVGFLGGIERSFLPRVIREFRDVYPEIDLSLHQYNWGDR